MPSLRELVTNPERRAKAQAWQAELRQRFGPSLNRHPAELAFVYGVDREKMVLGQLQAFKNLPLDTPERQRHFEFWNNSLAEGLAMQGRFREAAAISCSEDHARTYTEKATALEAFGQQCECPTTMVLPSARDAKGERVPARVKVESVFDGKNHISLSRCLHCAGLFAITE